MTATEEQNVHIRPKRPFLLSFLCVVGFTYTSLFSILFLVGMLYSTGISGILDKYLQLYDMPRMNFFFLSLGLFLVFFTAFIGVFLMWRLQKLGFYIYTASALIFVILESIIARPFLPDILIHLFLIIMFMIAFPFGKKRRARLTAKNILKTSKD
jgi:hypothetical protein